MSRPAHEIEKLRKHRARPAGDMSIAALVSATADQTSRIHKKLGTLIELWEELVPHQIAMQSSLNGLRAGVLHVAVDSSPVAFELDRLLRNGLTEQLRRRYGGTLVRIKVRIGEQQDSPQVARQASNRSGHTRKMKAGGPARRSKR